MNEELSEEEYSRFMRIVNTNFKRFSKDRFYTILIDNKYVAFEVDKFNEYSIIKVGQVDENNN